MSSRVLPFQNNRNDFSLSISDLMAGLLFIFMIALVVFAIVLNTLIEKKKEQLHQMTNAREIRDEILLSLEKSLDEQGVQVLIDLENGILRIPEQVLFRSGSASLDSAGYHSMRVVALVLDSLLPDYAFLAHIAGPDTLMGYYNKKKLEAILVEGHTDNMPLIAGAVFRDNWQLSAARSITTFKALVNTSPRLDSLLNSRGQKIFSVSGYADSRPVAENDREENRAYNRRIDLRFLMMPPDTLVIER